MATKRIKDITNTAASVASDAYLAIDGTSNGTEKITRDNFRQDTADAFVAAPGTYNLAPLSGGAVEVAKGGTGATTAAGARTNLSVNSKDEDAQANGTKVTAPALYFNGTSSEVTVANSSILDFVGNGNDLPMTISGTIVVRSNATNFPIWSAWNTFREIYAYVDTNGKLTFGLSDGSDDTYALGSTAIPLNQTAHVAITYPGAGPQSANDFPANQNGTKMYVNGVEESVTPFNDSSYSGLVVRNQPYLIGSNASDFGQGSIRDVKIFNRTLTSTEIAELARGNDLGFADEWGGAFGAIETSNFSGGVDGYSGSAGVLAGASTVGGESDALKFTVDNTSGTHSFSQLFSSIQVGKRYRIAFRYYVQSGQSNVDSLTVRYNNGSFDAGYGTTNDAWTPFVYEGIAADQTVEFYAADGSNINFQDAGGDDDIYVKDITITEIGTLADFRSERYDTSTNKLYDLSDNAFVGTGTSVTLTGREVPVYTTGQWTPVLIGATTSDFTYSLQEGFYTRIGDLCYVHGIVSISNLGTSAGAMSIGGLPFTSLNASGQQIPATIGFASGFTGLTSSLSAAFGDNSTTISLWKWAATGVSSVIETDMTNSADIRFGGVYKIQ